MRITVTRQVTGERVFGLLRLNNAPSCYSFEYGSDALDPGLYDVNAVEGLGIGQSGEYIGLGGVTLTTSDAQQARLYLGNERHATPTLTFIADCRRAIDIMLPRIALALTREAVDLEIIA